MRASSSGMWQLKRDRFVNRKAVAISKEKSYWEVVQKSWWLLLFWAVCFVWYSQAMQKKSKVCTDLKDKIKELESLKQNVLEEQDDLVLQINSQNDSAWVEMILKKKLGVVPEGQMKVYFKKEE